MPAPLTLTEAKIFVQSFEHPELALGLAKVEHLGTRHPSLMQGIKRVVAPYTTSSRRQKTWFSCAFTDYRIHAMFHWDLILRDRIESDELREVLFLKPFDRQPTSPLVTFKSPPPCIAYATR